MGEAGAEIVYNSVHISIIIDISGGCKAVAGDVRFAHLPSQSMPDNDYLLTVPPGVTMPGPIV